MNFADVVDWLRSLVCLFRGHKLVEHEGGQKWCVRCRRKIIVAP